MTSMERVKAKLWTLEDAVAVAIRIEGFAPTCGAHIGLTGGVLYKVGPRKDLDLVVYRIRQKDRIDREVFFQMLKNNGIFVDNDYGFVVKATAFGGRKIDFLFPEDKGGYA